MHGTNISPEARLPTAAGGITRLACKRLDQDGIPVLPLLRKAGVSKSFIEDRHARLAVQAQIRFLNEAAEAASDECIGFHLAKTSTFERSAFSITWSRRRTPSEKGSVAASATPASQTKVSG